MRLRNRGLWGFGDEVINEDTIYSKCETVNGDELEQFIYNGIVLEIIMADMNVNSCEGFDTQSNSAAFQPAGYSSSYEREDGST